MAAYPRARLLLLTLSLCFTAPHAAVALSFSYDFSSNPSDLNASNLSYLGDAIPLSDRISLTNMTQWSTGRVAYLQPVRLWDDHGKRASFTTVFSFFIGGYNGTSNNGTDDRGEGMAFFIAPPAESMPSDAGGAFLGLFHDNNSSNGDPSTFGVEFDTFYNEGLDPPGVTADHIGIDIDNISSVVYTQLPNLTLSGYMSAAVHYDASSMVMSVTLWPGHGNNLTSIRKLVDLMAAGVPQYATVGFSAATGDLLEVHELLSWSFSSTSTGPPSKMELWVVTLIAAASALLAGFVAALVYYTLTMNKRQTRPQIQIPMDIVLPVARKFKYRKLSEATKHFSEDRALGAGAFGKVYRGDLRDPRMPAAVAVKVLTGEIDEQSRKGYVTEIMTLGQISHRNLVKLVGWCGGRRDSHLLLVYELVTNGSLDEHLHDSERRPLTWPERYKIVLGVGSALHYLHTGHQNPILHRDIKPSNVMLDDAFEAKLGDFGLVRQAQAPGTTGRQQDDDALEAPKLGNSGSGGLVRQAPGTGSRQGYLTGTAMIGSWNYIDPVCISSETASTASDVYSFGVLLLEVATGKKPQQVPVDDQDAGLRNDLVNAVRGSYAKGALLQMADARLQGRFDESQMERVLLVGLLCAQRDRRDRPDIREAITLLSNLRLPLP